VIYDLDFSAGLRVNHVPSLAELIVDTCSNILGA